MVARTTPTVISKPGPPKPEDDTERLHKLLDLMRRNLIASLKAAEEIIEISERQRAA